jgi:signal peptidase I
VQQLVRFLVWATIAVGLIVGIARLVAIRWWTVPEGDPWLEASVAPSLRGGDLVILWRATKPTLGDLVVCPEPGAPERVVIGRIAGQAGDTIKVGGRHLVRNGESIKTERACLVSNFSVRHPKTGEKVEQLCQMEDFAGVIHKRGSASGQEVTPPEQEFKVPEGHLFLVSDNRLFPYDSRDFGTVNRRACRETVLFRLVSKAGYHDVENRFTLIR